KRDGITEDMRFHRAILAATQNEYFIGFGDFLEVRVRSLIRTARINTARQGDLVYEVQREHEAIHAAVAAQDAEAAQHAAQQHLQNAAARLSYYQAGQTP
ncbi:MAG: FCD domain-containing protein, partial [Gammaproteobacteria bacterium]|nr:FCD domain-containing protein [Gammaproteobacteria bacterium]